MNNSFKNSLNNEKPNEAQWRARLAYKCGICGTEFESIKNRAECEIKCSKMKEEREKFAAAKKKAEEKAERKKAVDEAFDKAYKLKDEYVKDYSSYMYTYEDEDEYSAWSFADFIRMLP